MNQAMGMTEISGLPAHILLIHLVVIGIPLAALLTVLSAVWPAARRRLGIVTPIVALGALIMVPITTNAGEWLQARVYQGFTNPLIVRHAELGDQLLPWAIGLFLLGALAWGLPVLAGRPGAAAALSSTPPCRCTGSATRAPRPPGRPASAAGPMSGTPARRVDPAGDQGSSSNFPVVRRAARSSCARAASAKG